MACNTAGMSDNSVIFVIIANYNTYELIVNSTLIGPSI